MQKALAALILVLCICLFGCDQKSYQSEADFSTARAKEMNADESTATWASLPNGQRWRIWILPSGQAWMDRFVDNKVVESQQFGSKEEADAWIADQSAKGQPPKLSEDAWRAQRSGELNGATGAWINNTDGRYFYLWQLPDGSFVLDTVISDGHGGVTFDATKDSKPFTTREEAVAGAGEIRGSVRDYLRTRPTELSATPDWGQNQRNWQLYAFKGSDGKYTLDIVRPEPDVLEGVLRQRSNSFNSLNELAAWTGSQMKDKDLLWATATQYAYGGWALILYVVIIIFFVLFNIARARRGQVSTIRRIAGLDQIDEAVGRATEIARPVLMVPGLGVLNGITVQAITIFAYIIRTAARFGTPIRLLNADASVYAVAQEIAREVYQSEGVPEQYDPTSVQFVSDRQFAFAAGVAGVIQRERVAATFFMGDFFAESMIFAENANMVGAIQVAATTQFTQTPFFIAACDYVLLGDEFYAASAYLGRQPVLVGSLIGVDWAKMFVIATVIIAAGIHTYQTTRPVNVAALPSETRDVWTKNNQQYMDWRKDDLFLKRLTKRKRS